MSQLLSPDNPQFQKRMWPLFRQFFRKAERNRRWDLENDIPWDKVNPNTSATIAGIVESFCAVELFLPDYVAKALPLIRTNRAWAWTHINWGYEEAKHSMALEDWLVRSGHRTEEYVADLAQGLLQHEWNLPLDTGAGMLIYAMVQELATWLNYRNLRLHVSESVDPCLFAILGHVMVDERSHFAYYKEVTQIFLEIDRPGTLEILRRVLGNFSMPALGIIAQSPQFRADICAMNIFSDEIFFRDVYQETLKVLGIDRQEMRSPRRVKKTDPEPLHLDK